MTKTASAILTLAQARSDCRSRPSRPVTHPRLATAPGDPPWFGRRLRLRVDGRTVDFYFAGAMAAALGVSRDTLLKLEARGIFPKTRYVAPGGWPGNGQARLYTREQLLAVAAFINRAGLRGRRLSYQSGLVRAELERIFALPI